jgi:hypothetical protein
MPIGNTGLLNPASNQNELLGVHNHCEELQNTGDASAEINLNKSIDHFCCSIFAVLPTATIVTFPHQKTAYLVHPLDEQISHIENSIYKPPKHLFV